MSAPAAAIDGNEAVADVAYRLSEVVAIYPITPASPMGELSDEWATAARPNLWGRVPDVIEMQSEAGAAGAVHGALQGGALATTFTASQGLLLMIPEMYKIAGELTPFVMHVAARALATHALSIFCDHSDVMAVRQTGFALLCAGSVQEAHDLAAVAHAVTLRARVPFLCFMDGFRTSHELQRVARLSDEDLRALVDEELVLSHRGRALSPDRPSLRGTAQNPDAFFQGREAANPFHEAVPGLVQAAFDRLGERSGRRYRLCEYVGHPQAERVLVLMGSAAETAHETVERLVSRGERVGVLKLRLYRPFPAEALLAALPPTTRAIAVLDRTKEPGATGEPLYLDVVAALHAAREEGTSPFAAAPRVTGGRYGLGSKELTPAMLLGVFAELARERPRRGFTLGILDDVSGRSLPWDRELDPESPEVTRAVFHGLGSDGTVGANKASIKILAEETDLEVQGFFVYDSKKSGAATVSHLRFGPRPIRSAYLIHSAGFVACHQWRFLHRREVLAQAAPGATVLLNAPWPADEVWARLPREAQALARERGLSLWAIDADRLAREQGMPGRINGIMQAGFFALSGVLPRERALTAIRASIEKTYARKGAEVVRRNLAALDDALAHLAPVPIPAGEPAGEVRAPVVPAAAPDFVQRVTARLLAGEGDLLPVSAFPPDGTWPTGTTRWERRDLAAEIPVWDAELCIQCGKCAFVCPHAAVRAAAYPQVALQGAELPGAEFRSRELPGLRYTIQVAPEDCTGCTLCSVVCPAKDRADPRRKALVMSPQAPLRERERARWETFLALPQPPREALPRDPKHLMLARPLFEFSGACAGCGETPYLKLLTQLVGDRLLVANATGCSSIYGGNLPTTPWATDEDGRGPAWANSLFEDDAEFGLGIRLAVDHQAASARALLARLAPRVGEDLARALLEARVEDDAAVRAQRERVAALRARLRELPAADDVRTLGHLADLLVPKSVWIVGGDGWAYDIGFGGLDHVLSTGRKVNVLVLDTEVYSNTGGQQSKATPLAAAAKFAAGGKATPKKDLGLYAMTLGGVYVARVAFGAKDGQVIKAMAEAESYPGPALVLAYSPCIAHGYDLARQCEQQQLAVQSGHWPLYRFDPRRRAAGQAPLQLDSPPPRIDLGRFAQNEARFRIVEAQDAVRYRALLAAATATQRERQALLDALARPPEPAAARPAAPAPPA